MKAFPQILKVNTTFGMSLRNLRANLAGSSGYICDPGRFFTMQTVYQIRVSYIGIRRVLSLMADSISSRRPNLLSRYSIALRFYG